MTGNGVQAEAWVRFEQGRNNLFKTRADSDCDKIWQIRRASSAALAGPAQYRGPRQDGTLRTDGLDLFQWLVVQADCHMPDMIGKPARAVHVGADKSHGWISRTICDFQLVELGTACK